MRLRLPKSWVKATEGRQYFDEDLKQDSLDLLEAAAALEVKEFKLFELAYREWYGEKPLSRVIEVHFSNYMFNNVIPSWVRSYSRNIVKLHKAGKLDPKAFGIYHPLPSKRLVFIGRVFSTLLIFVFLVFMFLLNKEPPITKSLFGRADVSQEFERPQHHAIP
ncbi:MAG: hypothetical protein QNI91_06985 [Arenicellales bacterium]|nr:hypothetical protein [Arenicellales bacterium]